MTNLSRRDFLKIARDGFLALLALIPYIFPQPNEAKIGSWFPKSNRLAQIIVAIIGMIIIILTFINR
jgi:hypothetical protein